MDFVLDDEEDDDLVVGDDVGVGIGASYILWWQFSPRMAIFSLTFRGMATVAELLSFFSWHRCCCCVAVAV